MIQARYHLHLAVPFLLFAGASAPLLLRGPRWMQILVAVVALASPLMHLDFEQETDFGMQQEFEFLTSLRSEIPAGCNVVEFLGSSKEKDRRSSRIFRVAQRYNQGRWVPLWRVIPVSTPSSNPEASRDPRHLRGLPLRDVVQEVRASNRCTYLYAGNLCWYFQSDVTMVSSPCDDIRAQFELDEVATKEFINHTYDPSDEIMGVDYGAAWQERKDKIKLSLYRVKGFADPEEP